MSNLLKKIVISTLLIVTVTSIVGQSKRESVYVKTPIFEVWYNEVYEQPMKLIYKSENRETNVNRGSMDFKTLIVTVELVFEEGHEVLPTGGHIPTRMVKHILFTKDNIYKCFDFENIKPKKKWKDHIVLHKH